MAVMDIDEEPEPGSGSLRERKRRATQKLIFDDEVEVRSVEDGFQGSWHPGIVIASEKQGTRQVRYYHLLYDDGSDNLVDVVSVSPFLDGIGSFTGDRRNYRGNIRPKPPNNKPGKWDLCYGLCVDVFHQEAWWEGVVFDHEDGSEERRIFFPDLGDELKTRIDTMRITHDWDEVTDNWKRRGTWIFLELLEHYDQERYIPVSIKQIWYDVRQKEGFKNVKEWTSPVRHLWEELVLGVIDDNINITIDELFGVLDKSGFSPLETQVELNSADFVSDANMNPKENIVDSLAIIPVHDPVSSDLLVDRENAANDVLNCSAGIIDERYANGVLSIDPDSNCAAEVQEKSYRDRLISVAGNTGGVNTERWQLLDIPAEFFPDAVDEYADLVKGMPKKFTLTAVRQHLSYLGWKTYFTKENGKQRYLYVSPGKECEYSLLQLCKKLKNSKKDTLFLISQDSHQGWHDSAEQPLPIEQTQESQHPTYCPQIAWSPCSEVFIFKPEYIPEAVVEYYKYAADKTIKKKLRKMISKAKKHLSAVGWVFSYSKTKSSKNLYYKSPNGKVFRTLLSACKSCMDEGLSEKRPAECMYVVEEDEGQLTRHKIRSAASNLGKQWSRDSISMSGLSRKRPRKTNDSLSDLAPHLLQRQPNLHAGKDGSIELIGDEKLGCSKDHCTRPPKLRRRKGSRALNGLRNGLHHRHPTRVLRSSKQVQEVVTPSSSHNSPRTVLSWLIDNRMVSPRAKVYYRSTKDSHPMKEGRITRKGIRCSCCQEVYTLSCFGSHAGSSYHRPSANIFLENGKSLLDRQMEIMNERKKRSVEKEPHNRMNINWRRGDNDYICTVCHYGGDLILCDQCPSSFHKCCLGLKVVPDGDWFCPSCCCGICGQTNFKEDKVPTMDDSSVLTCGQCERNYHKGCLRERGDDKLETDIKGNWFCSKSCEKIFFGIETILGKQIPVGDGNLSWSLLRFSKCDNHDTDEPDIDDALAESHSRLNVALDVMHECFVPVQEPLTRSDLVEDVLFNRRSDLNRLNFRGFYTVLLERNDELITVATIRIFGDKVAELPLVATRFVYRRRGMCRILMDELEKMLMNFGVEKLVLPAVSSVLHTWTNSFGFSQMMPSERLQFLDCTFLDFQGTIMCQKQLMKSPPAEATPLTRTQLVLNGDICTSPDNNTDFDWSSAISEVHQAEHVKDCDIVPQRVENAGGNETTPFSGESSPELSSLEDANYKSKSVAMDKPNYCFKFYKRRRISANGNKPSYAITLHATQSN